MNWDSTSASCELVWAIRPEDIPGIYQLRFKTGYTNYEKKDEKWDFSVSVSGRFRHGRLSIKAESADFQNDWKWTVSWRAEI